MPLISMAQVIEALHRRGLELISFPKVPRGAGLIPSNRFNEPIMWDSLSKLLDVSDFPARWQCGNWSDALGWLHILSDLAIFAAYMAIPIGIAFFVWRRRDLSYPLLCWVFAAFILSCGLVHLIEATIFWRPWYRLSGVMKLITAVVSWGAVVTLFQLMPQILQLPGIRKLNTQLLEEIEERKAAENEVMRLNQDLGNRVEELQALLNLIPVGIGITHDREACNIRSNAMFSRLLKLPGDKNASLSAPDGERPKHFRVLHDGRELAVSELPIQFTARTGEPLHDYEEEVVFDDGERVHLLAYTTPLRDENQQVRGAVGVFVDITARKHAEMERIELEHELQRTQKLESLRILAGGVAHDFNNLLTIILGYASMARLEAAEGKQCDKHLAQIETASLRAADLCKQMLAYSGKGKFELRQTDINQLVEDTKSLLQISMRNNAELQLQLDPEISRVLADPTQIQQILMNLVLNATEALGDQSGVISIRTGQVFLDHSVGNSGAGQQPLPAGNYTWFEVSDTGSGISREALPRIFDPFFTTKFTGRGLGLAAVLGIVRSHKGGIEVISEMGQGARFRVLLPACSVTVEPARQAPQPASRWVGEGLVLVVDDEESVLGIAARMVASFGFSPLQANSGKEAVEVFRRRGEEIAAVLLDLTMPGMGGEEVFRELRAMDPDVRVLLMSGYGEKEALSRFVGAGVAGFVQKPFCPDDLRSKLQSVLGRQGVREA